MRNDIVDQPFGALKFQIRFEALSSVCNHSFVTRSKMTSSVCIKEILRYFFAKLQHTHRSFRRGRSIDPLESRGKEIFKFTKEW
jgi:hypothetical protein